MDLQQLVDSYEPMSCIISVQVFPDGHYGNIRIVCGNKAYINSIENSDNIAYSEMLKNAFIPNSPYDMYIPKDLNFEDACYRCAVLKKPFHTYIHPERYSFWVDMYMMPLAVDQKDTYYFVYSQEFTKDVSVRRMSNIDPIVSSSVLETCIKLHGTKDFKHTMDEVMNDLRQLCDAEKVCLILTDMQRRTFSILSAVSGFAEADSNFENYLRQEYDDFFDIIETWDDSIAGSTCLIIQDENDMNILHERNPKWCDSLKEVDTKSIVLYPLRYNNDTLGYIWAINFNIKNTVRIRATLESTSFFIASELANHKLMNELRRMGSYDTLTGVKNRNAMNLKVDSIVQNGEKLPDNTAVLFVDLNGLKQTNDNNGHANGDKMLQKAAEVLKEVFYDNDIYRAGGDEFMILATGLSEDDLNERLKKIEKYQTDSEDISFAVGCCYSDGKIDIRQAMSTADKRMYKDKQEYYERYSIPGQR